MIDWLIGRLIDWLICWWLIHINPAIRDIYLRCATCCYVVMNDESGSSFNEIVSRWTNMSIGQINQFTKPYQPFMDSANWQDFVFISYDILSDHARGSLHDINIIMQRWTRTMSHNSSATIRSMMFISLCHLKVDMFIAPWSWRSSYHQWFIMPVNSFYDVAHILHRPVCILRLVNGLFVLVRTDDIIIMLFISEIGKKDVQHFKCSLFMTSWQSTQLIEIDEMLVQALLLQVVRECSLQVANLRWGDAEKWQRRSD